MPFKPYNMNVITTVALTKIKTSCICQKKINNMQRHTIDVTASRWYNKFKLACGDVQKLDKTE